MEQMSLLEDVVRSDGLKKQKQAAKRKWENALQKWSDNHGIESDNTEDYGCCGYGSMCDWCEDNSYGRPCIRALNKMCREKGLKIDYSDRNFERLWREGVKE